MCETLTLFGGNGELTGDEGGGSRVSSLLDRNPGSAKISSLVLTLIGLGTLRALTVVGVASRLEVPGR